MADTLRRFLTNLASDRKALGAFITDPEAAVAAAELPEEDAKAVLSRDPNRIGLRMMQDEDRAPAPMLVVAAEDLQAMANNPAGLTLFPNQPVTFPIRQLFPVFPQLQPQVAPTIQPQIGPPVFPQLQPQIAPTIQPQITPMIQPQVGPPVFPQLQPQIAPTIQPQIAPLVFPQLQPQVAPTIMPQISPTFSQPGGVGAGVMITPPAPPAMFFSSVPGGGFGGVFSGVPPTVNLPNSPVMFQMFAFRPFG